MKHTGRSASRTKYQVDRTATINVDEVDTSGEFFTQDLSGRYHRGWLVSC